jgi:hypothetical protein
MMIFEVAMGTDDMGSSFSKPDCVLFPQPRANMRIDKSDNLFMIV